MERFNRRLTRRELLIASISALGGLALLESCKGKSLGKTILDQGNQDLAPISVQASTPEKKLEPHPTIDEDNYFRQQLKDQCSSPSEKIKMIDFGAYDLNDNYHRLSEYSGQETFMVINCDFAYPKMDITKTMISRLKNISDNFGSKLKYLLVILSNQQEGNTPSLRRSYQQEIRKISPPEPIKIWFANDDLKSFNEGIFPIEREKEAYPKDYLLDENQNIIFQCMGWLDDRFFQKLLSQKLD